MLLSKVQLWEVLLALEGQKIIQPSYCELFKSDLHDWEGYSTFDVTFAGIYDVSCGSVCLLDGVR